MFVFRTGKGRQKSVHETSVKILYSTNSDIIYVSRNRANAGRYLRTDGIKHERAIREKVRQKLSVFHNSSGESGKPAILKIRINFSGEFGSFEFSCQRSVAVVGRA